MNLLRLHTWRPCLSDLGECRDAILAPSARRLLLLLASRNIARLFNLGLQQLDEVGICAAQGQEHFAWGCQSDCYSQHAPFQELLFTCGSKGILIYGFSASTRDECPLPALELDAQLVVDHGGGTVRLLFPPSNGASLVAFRIDYHSASFDKLVTFARQEEEDVAVVSRLLSDSSNTLVGMLLGATVVLLRVCAWELCWIARVRIPADLDWVDLALVGERLVCLAQDGRLLLWSAATGRYLGILDAPSPRGPFTRLIPAGNASPVLGAMNKLGQLFLVSHQQPFGSDCETLSVAASDISHPSGSRPSFSSAGLACGPSAFTPKRLLTPSSHCKRQTRTMRRVLLPTAFGSSIAATAINSRSVTSLVRNKDNTLVVLQSVLAINSSADAEYHTRDDVQTALQTEALAFCYQGSLYLLSETCLEVVLPHLGVENAGSQQPWWLTDANTRHSDNILAMTTPLSKAALQRWQVEILDRALIYDAQELAEYLSTQNGWSLRHTRLRKLELLLSYARTDEIQQILDELVPVGAAGMGVPRVIFTATKLMVNKFGSDNELAQAARLLAIAARFTKKLLKGHGVRERTSAGIAVNELARFLEIIRSLQEHLYSRQKRRQPDKGESEAIDLDKRKQQSAISINDPTNSDTSSAAKPPSPEDIVVAEERALKDPSLETPREMVIRWEKENVDLSGIVKDALRAGRVPLAVVQLHHRQRRAAMGNISTELDIFKEVQEAGRSIVYELLCKGKVPIALAALRRLGEDIRTVLYDLALGTVRRSLRDHATRELRRHDHIEAESFRLIHTISHIEENYPSSKFWSSYNARLKASGNSAGAVTDGRLRLCCSTAQGAFTVECGEVDGVVLGSWKTAVSNEVDEEASKEQASPVYWASAAIWLQSWDQRTIDRIILEQSCDFPSTNAPWRSQLDYNLVHHLWPNVSSLLGIMPSAELLDLDLQVHLGEASRTVHVPKVKHLPVELEGCTSWLSKMVQLKLVERFVFSKSHWTDRDLISLLATSSLVFSASNTVDEIHQSIVRHCLEHNLPWLLELYLDERGVDIDVRSLLPVAEDSTWARWLLFLRQRGFDYEASFANAQAVCGSSAKCLDDLAKSGNVLLAMSTLMYAPAVPQKCLQTAAKHPWQCSIEHLRHVLEQFPTLWTNLKLFRYEKPMDNDEAEPRYLTWRKSLFTCATGDISLMEMLSTLLPIRFRKLLHYSIEGPGDEAFIDPFSWETLISMKMYGEAGYQTLGDARSLIESYLVQGRPLAAFNHFLVYRQSDGKHGEFSQLTCDEDKLLEVVMPLAIESFKSMVVTSACTTFLELAGVSPVILRTDISALRRISEYNSDSEELATDLAEQLSGDYARSKTCNASSAALLILSHLEKATLDDELGHGSGAWLKTGIGDGQELRGLQLAMSERWSLVTRFCRVHQLPPSTTYLSYLARDDDWVGFLAEAQAEACPLDVLLTASNCFTDDRLRRHVSTVLESLLSDQSSGAHPSKSNAPTDLFHLLATSEQRKFPGKELLEKAKSHRWPLLAVVASCFGDVTPLSCLSAWLEVTVARELPGGRVSDGAAQLTGFVRAAVDAANTRTSSEKNVQLYARERAKRRRLHLAAPADFLEAATDSSEHAENYKHSGKDSGDDHESLAKLVAILCEQQRFLPLLRAFELFLPASPLLHFIRFLRAFSQMRLPEASAHLADFSAFLREDMHSKGGKSSTVWISRAAVAGAEAMLRACPSAYEKRCMLQLLATADFGDGGLAAVRFRRLYWKIQLAEPSLHQDGHSVVQGSNNLEDETLLTALEKSGQWEEARSWARQLDFGSQASSRAVDHVTEMQAEAMVTEWKELLWDMPEQRAALWRHCQALFTKHSYPPLKAGFFFMKHAEDIEQNGSPSELHGILLLALQWLSGSITGSAPVYPVPLLRELETRVWLLAVESEVLLQANSGSASASLPGLSIESPLGLVSNSGSPVDRTAAKIAAVDGHLKAYNFMTVDEARQLQNVEKQGNVPKLKRRLIKRNHGPEREHAGTEVNERKTSVDEPAGWEDKVGEGEVERAILALVEVGQVSAARQLQQKLSPSRVPLELVLAETALSIAMLSTPMVKGAVGSSPVLKTLATLNLLKDVSSASPLQVMEALTATCREGCGRGYCRRITAIAQVANFLGMSFYEAFQKQATELLQLLSLKGQDALAEAKLLVATHSINPASVARLLAESFLKGLLAAHRGGYMDSSSKEEGPAPLLWRSSDFVQWGQLCPSEPELGHALMRLVISGHDMPHACEVELLILAHQFYESSACLDGMDVLVALAATRVECYVAEGDFTALARLVTGVSNFQALRFVLDLLIENGQLELLLKKRPVAVDATKESSAWVRGFRMALLSALKHFNPHDLDAFGMVFSHFSMAHEMANLLESRGRKGLSHWFVRGDQEQNDETLDLMRLFVEASEVYAGIECGNKTRYCCAQASILSLQLRMPELSWLSLSETNARRLLVEQRRFQEALVVAEAYALNQPAEWVPVLWSQVLSSGWVEHFLAEFAASLPLWPSMLLELARIYRSEVSARGDRQLDFSKWLLTPGMPPEIAKSFRCILKHVRDFRLRTQLATMASGFPDVLDVCARVLDKVPDTAGPLVLKRGHGGTYVSLM